MTREEFYKIVVDLNNGNEVYVKAAHLGRAVDSAAQNCWINQVPENEKTKILREQLLYQEKHGHFNFTEEPQC